MARSRDGWLIGATCLIMFLAVGVVGFSMVTENNRATAVKKLRDKAPAGLVNRVGAAARKGQAAANKAAVPNTSEQQPSASNTSAPAEADTIAAFKQLCEKKKAIKADAAWVDACEILSKKNMSEWTDEDRKQLAKYMGANREVIEELMRLADNGGPFYELDYSKGFAMEMPHLAELRDDARLLAADAALNAGQNNYDLAVKEILAGMKLANVLSDEPLLISQLVRIAMNSIMWSAVDEAIQGDKLTPDQARGLIQYAGGAGCREAFANSFNGEGMFGLAAFDDIRTGQMSGSFYGGDNWNLESTLLRLYGTPFLRPWLNTDEESYAGIMTRMTDAMRLPYYEAKPLLDGLQTEMEAFPRTRVLSRMLLPALTRTGEAQARNEACMDLMRLGVAVEQYHAQNGRYPQTLDAVAPTLGGAVPLDPYTGRPYVYQASAGAFSLSSARGSVVPAATRSGAVGVIDANGNIVWRGH